MKKILLTLSVVVLSLAASAQQKSVYINSYSGTDIQKFDGQQMNIRSNRYVFNGWNTLCLPFSMNKDEIQTSFGNVRIAALTAAQDCSDGVTLVFTDVNEIKANTPYLIYYTGENKSVNLNLKARLSYDANPATTVTTPNGVIVRFAGATKHIQGEGFYGILAKDNKNAQFVSVDKSLSGFYATRCYVELSKNTEMKVYTVFGDDPTGINNVGNVGNAGNVENFNLAGQKVDGSYKGIVVNKGKKNLRK